MATKKSQRIVIWVISIVMLVGTIGGFVAMMIDPGGEMRQKAESDRQMAEWQKQIEQAAKERAESSEPLEGYEASKFDASTISELKTEILVQGEGDELEGNSTILANYFGWTSDGSIFDSTNQGGTQEPVQFSLEEVIEGWTIGLTGIRVGSVVRLTIPSNQAYGEAGSPPNIGANEPLQFIVEVREKVVGA